MTFPMDAEELATRARELVEQFEDDIQGMDTDGEDMREYDETRSGYEESAWELIRNYAENARKRD